MALAVSASQVQVAGPDTVFANGRAYRLFRIDTPQADATCALERLRAEHLAAVVGDLVAAAHDVEIRPGFNPRGRQNWPNDHRGTRLARISLDGQDLGGILIARGLAYRWDNRNKRHWCLPNP
jgi:endonuclease YncB( thermonuclease family)